MPPEIEERANDPTVNVPLEPPSADYGSGFADLLAFGLTAEAYEIIVEMVEMTYVIDRYSEGSLLNPDMIVLIQRRNRVHHRLLCLPTGAEQEERLGSAHQIYECCRIAAFLYATAALFPLPRSTGLPQRLVVEIQQCIEQISEDFLFGAGRQFIAWVLTLAGTAAMGMPERQWFQNKVIEVLSVESVSRWVELKRILASFLWMDSVCNEGGIEFWDEIVTDLRQLHL